MKRVLALLSLVCALFVTSACHFDVNLSVDADATLFYPDAVTVGPAHYEGFHHKNLTDYDLEDIARPGQLHLRRAAPRHLRRDQREIPAG